MEHNDANMSLEWTRRSAAPLRVVVRYYNNMTIPYYARHRSDIDIRPEEVDIVFFWPTVVRTLVNVSKRKLIDLPHNMRLNLISGIAFIEHRAKDKKAALLRYHNIVATYHELLCLAADTGLYQRLYHTYSRSFDLLQEGQNDLFNSNDLVRNSKNLDPEVKFRALLDKYHVQHEGNLRYTITPVVVALDAIIGHPDFSRKDENAYCADDLSYKSKKVSDNTGLKINGQMTSLLIGIEPHIRNAISHRTFEYLANGQVKFTDRHKSDLWHKTLTMTEFDTLVFDADVAINAHVAAQTLFIHDYQSKIDFTAEPFYRNDKQLRSLIDQEMIRLRLTPVAIELSKENNLISLIGTKEPGTDHPSDVFGVMAGGVRFHRTRPSLKGEEQALHLLEYIATLDTPFKKCTVTVLDFCDKSPIGIITANMSQMTAIKKSQAGTLDEFLRQIESNTFPKI